MTSAGVARPTNGPERHAPGPAAIRPAGVRWVLAAELFASGLGFAVMVHLARRLGPPGFARLEYASAVAAWLLVVVRGGVDVIVYREAARRPRLVRPLTEVLVGLRCLAATAGYAAVLGLAALVGEGRGPVVLVAGLILVPSAFVTDAGLRASGRLAWIGLAQGLRALAYAALAVALVRDPDDALAAAWCLVAGEVCGAAIPLAWHVSAHGMPRWRFRRRAWAAVALRGLIAGLIRFGRVSLYGADLLTLGWWAGPELGDYAAARRVVFGFVALGLVLPAAVAPAIARRWAAGPQLARALVEESLVRTWALSVPAALVLMVAGGGWMALLFGERYRQGGAWLALIAARLPWLLTASIVQTALVSCRRERWVLDQTLAASALALVLLPASIAWAGPWGAGWAALAIEVVVVIAGWRKLGAIGLAPTWDFRRRVARGVAS